MARGTCEFELKFTGAPGNIAALRESLFLKAVAPGEGAWERLSSTYFDTPDLLLRGMQWSLAIGFVGGLFPALRAASIPVTVALREL